MAFRRSVTARAKIFYQQQRVAVPFSHIDRDDNDRQTLPLHNPISKGSEISDYIRRRCLFGAGDNVGRFGGSRNSFQDRRFAMPAAFGSVFVRNMSTIGEGPGDDKFEKMTDMADVLGDKAVEVAAQVAPVANEVAAAVSGFFPQDACAYLIDHVHTFTGCNWWASIAITTILIRTLILPLTILQIKAAYAYSGNKSPIDEAGAVARLKRSLLNQYGLKQFTLAASLCAPLLVIMMFNQATFKMVDTIESFKHGGALWFTDLTATDPTYILPLLTVITFWIAMECHNDGIMHMRGVYALSILTAACAPKAILCIWATSNLYGLAYAMVMKKSEVKKMLGIPNVEEAPQYSLSGTVVKPALLIEMAMLSFVMFHVATRFLIPSFHI